MDEELIISNTLTQYTPEQNLYLFALNQDGTAYVRRFRGEIYYCKIWDNDVLVRDFTPVPAGDTTYSSEPATSNCMYDKVTKQYFTNEGTESFGIEQI